MSSAKPPSQIKAERAAKIREERERIRERQKGLPPTHPKVTETNEGEGIAFNVRRSGGRTKTRRRSGRTYRRYSFQRRALNTQKPSSRRN